MIVCVCRSGHRRSVGNGRLGQRRPRLAFLGALHVGDLPQEQHRTVHEWALQPDAQQEVGKAFARNAFLLLVNLSHKFGFRFYPDYYEEIENPISLLKIKAKLRVRKDSIVFNFFYFVLCILVSLRSTRSWSLLQATWTSCLKTRSSTTLKTARFTRCSIYVDSYLRKQWINAENYRWIQDYAFLL